MSINPWLALLAPAVIALVAWVVRATLLDRIKGLEEGNRQQGKRIGDLESWTVAHDAVESERRHVREDTRGVPQSIPPKGRR
jgi:hypothetical protein